MGGPKHRRFMHRRGEAFIRTVAAHSVAVYHRTVGLEEAARIVLEEVEPLGGRGGLIAVNVDGEVVMPFQTMLMYRGLYVDGDCKVGIGPTPCSIINA